ncbi:SDR family oxidoreductase [Polaribacter sp. IC063]|uniref:SDR family oxidoreductase n=1 Tax=Polaribacter sp. IC063 TaxID=57031 RepID=UPI0011BD9387|nr:SDR family oxidoreductase [Polaribacter sp. IC063]TXD51444.1 SDR family oxidoreductase [Polaribacter sp. IC063]
MKKVLVIGCNGMAGHVVKRYLESNNSYDVWGIARGVKTENNLINLDVSSTKELENILKVGNFEVVINCIGLLNKTAEDNPELAVWFNSYFPQLLASLGEKYQFKLIHISTDCVFSGKEGGYKENSFKNGIGFYAQSKALGEVVNTKDLTFRTSIIGPELKESGIGLFHWFMNQTNEIFGYKEAYWSGVTTIELAKGIQEAIQQNLTGLYHFVNNSKICKYDLVNEFNAVFRNDKVTIIPKSDYKVDKSLINTRKDFKYIVPSYKFMIQEMKKWMLEDRATYKHYDY